MLGLPCHLEELLAILDGLSGSLGNLEGGNVRSALNCSLLERVINLYTDVIALMHKILELLDDIGTSTGNSQLDNLIVEMETYYNNIILKWEGEQMSGRAFVSSARRSQMFHDVFWTFPS